MATKIARIWNIWYKLAANMCDGQMDMLLTAKINSNT